MHLRDSYLNVILLHFLVHMIIDNLEAPYSFFAVSEIWFLIKESTIKLYFLFKNALHVHNVKCITGQSCLHRKSLKSRFCFSSSAVCLQTNFNSKLDKSSNVVLANWNQSTKSDKIFYHLLTAQIVMHNATKIIFQNNT